METGNMRALFHVEKANPSALYAESHVNLIQSIAFVTLFDILNNSQCNGPMHFPDQQKTQCRGTDKFRASVIMNLILKLEDNTFSILFDEFKSIGGTLKVLFAYCTRS